jgi:hypothetical protein
MARICEILPYDGSLCNSDLGGINALAVIELKNVLTLTIASGVVTAMTIVGGTDFEEWIVNDDNTASLVETPPSRDNSLVVQTLTANFSGVGAGSIALGDGVNMCCGGLVYFARYNNGLIRLFGIEYISTTDPMWRASVRRARAFVGTDSSTLEGKGITNLTIDSGAQYLGVTTSLTWTAILAL